MGRRKNSKKQDRRKDSGGQLVDEFAGRLKDLEFTVTGAPDPGPVAGEMNLRAVPVSARLADWIVTVSTEDGGHELVTIRQVFWIASPDWVMFYVPDPEGGRQAIVTDAFPSRLVTHIWRLAGDGPEPGAGDGAADRRAPSAVPAGVPMAGLPEGRAETL
jgi:hypothetical protein